MKTVWVVLTDGYLNTICIDAEHALERAALVHPDDTCLWEPVGNPGGWYQCAGGCRVTVAQWFVLGA